MFVKFKCWWDDGFGKHNPGQICDLPADAAKGYIMSGKVEACKAPAWATQDVDGKKKRKIPSARQRIKKVSALPQQQMSLKDIANEVMQED